MTRKILIIDDDPTIRDAFSSALEPIGYALDTATSGEEGVAKVKDNAFDLIYLDLKMPGIDGVKTLKMIRQFDPEVPVYIVTAFHHEYFSALESIKKEGIHFELLRKPLERAQIQDITKNIFGE